MAEMNSLVGFKRSGRKKSGDEEKLSFTHLLIYHVVPFEFCFLYSFLHLDEGRNVSRYLYVVCLILTGSKKRTKVISACT